MLIEGVILHADPEGMFYEYEDVTGIDDVTGVAAVQMFDGGVCENYFLER